MKLVICRWDPARTDLRDALPLLKDSVDPIRKIADGARTFHYENTLPWQDGGFRILGSKGFAAWCETVGRFRSAFDEEVERLLAVYPGLVELAAARLGDLYDPDRFPGVKELRACHGFRFTVNPLEDPPELRAEMAEGMSPVFAAHLRADVEAEELESRQRARRDLWCRASEVAKRLAETLGDPEKRFKNTLISQSAKMLDQILSLNLFADEELERVRQDLERLLLTDAATYRREPELRAEAAVQAAAILRQVQGMLARDSYRLRSEI